jgi:putative transposase
MVFHVLNRGNDRRRVFRQASDFEAFLRVMKETLQRAPMRILAFCLMPNHWHLLLWPEREGELAAFMQRLTTTHVRRWHLYRGSVGRGHLYQGTYKSFPVQEDDHFYSVGRYVERNALRANLVQRAEDWRWSSLAIRLGRCGAEEVPALSEWPVPRPRSWTSLVNQVQTEAELESLRVSLQRGRPYGSESWQQQTAKRLGLEFTFHPRGRPRKCDAWQIIGLIPF